MIGHDSDNLTDGYGGPQLPEYLYRAEEVTAILPEGFAVQRAGKVIRPVETDEGTREAIDKMVDDVKGLGPLGWSDNWEENGERLKALEDIVHEHAEAMEVPQ